MIKKQNFMNKNTFLIFLGTYLLFFISGCSQPFKEPERPVMVSEQPEESIETNPEAVLQDEVKLEKNDWSNVWIEDANTDDKPRFLFVGDSITEGYYSRVKERLVDHYSLGRYTTSKFINNPDYRSELEIVLQRYKFEVILLNNGLHGWGYEEADYQEGLELLIQLLNQFSPEATIIWCQTTPIRQEENTEYLDILNQRVIARNQLANKIMNENNYPIIDLYQEMIGFPEYYRIDGFHFTDKGRTAQAEFISSFTLENYP